MKNITLFSYNLLIIVLLFIDFDFKAQSIANYVSAYNTSVPYVSIASTGNSFASWRNTASFTQDDNRSNLTDIGFDFWYNGIRYTQFSISTNGFIDFSSSAALGGPDGGAYSYNNPAFTTSSAVSTTVAIAPFYDDMTSQGGTEALGNSMKYELSGSAPNRTLTIEWINMAVYGNTSPSLNFQVKLLENNGKILMNYGVMNTGTNGFTYSTGLNGQAINNPNTLVQLKTLQAANANNFSATPSNFLSIMPAANSQFVFTPPVPSVSAASLTFANVTQTSMDVKWTTDWSTNEVGYALYNSVDNVTFNYVTQAPANATLQNVTGLSPGTLYYWKVYAVTEGCLSNPITGSQITNAAGNKISNKTGSWNTATVWTPNGVPTSADNVIIADGHAVTINANAVCNNLTIGQGTSGSLTIGNNATGRTVTLSGSLTVNAGATFIVNGGNNATHSIILPSDIVNNGVINFSVTAARICNATFNKNGNQTISGSGSTTKFNLITMNMGSSVNNTLDIQTPSFEAASNFLTLTNGTFKLSTTGASNITPFTGAKTLTQYNGITLNSALSTINVGGNLTLSGKLNVDAGIFHVGSANNVDLISTGGVLSVSGGSLNIAGKYYSNSINNVSYFTLSGGQVTVPAFGSTAGANAPFDISGAGSVFNMSGGLVVIPKSGVSNSGFVNTGTSGGSVTGGTLQIGSATSPVGQTIQLNTNSSIGSLLINSANVNASLLTNTLNVINNIAINSGTLTANNLNLALEGNWVNSGGLFAPGTSSVSFLGTSAQSIYKSGGETFGNLVFSNAGTKTLLSAVTASNVLINSGSALDVNTTNNQLTVKGNFVNDGTFNARSGLVFFNGTTAQTISGTSTTDFYNITLTNPAGASITSPQNLINTLTLNTGTLNTNSAGFTMVSSATNTARIAEITGTGNIIGDVIVQRYVPSGTTGWALLGTPISSPLTMADWDDDFYISCASCPDGSAGGFVSVYSYDETQPGLIDAGTSYVALTSITNPITPNKGYWVYLGTSSSTTTPIVVDVTGTVRKFNQIIPLSYTNSGSTVDDGWNLIHNPYPSAISWAALRNSNANVENAIYVFNADLNGGSGANASYVNGVSSPAVGSGGIDDNIAMCQGFQVHCTGPATLTAQESNKVTGNPTFLKQSSVVSNSPPMLRVYLDGPYSFRDEAVVYIQPGATDNFDIEYDALKLAGQDPYAPVIMLQNNTNDFQINGINTITSSFSMPLKAVSGYGGTYTISAANFNSFPDGACISLYDNLTSTTTDLKSNDYVFSLDPSETTARFLLTITINPLNISTAIAQPVCESPNSGLITAVGNNSGPWNYYWFDSNGNNIKTSLNKTTADTLINLQGGSFSLNMNTVGQCDNKDSVFTVNAVVLPISQFTSLDTTYVYMGGNVVFNNNSTNSINYIWDFGDNLGTSFDNSPSYNFNSAGIYSVSLIAISSSGCSDTTYKPVVVVLDMVGLSANQVVKKYILKTLNENNYVVEYKSEDLSGIKIKLFDVNGRLVRDFGVDKSSDIYLKIDLSMYSPGVYYLNLLGVQTNSTIKLIAK
jgi:hypothetical protein